MITVRVKRARLEERLFIVYRYTARDVYKYQRLPISSICRFLIRSIQTLEFHFGFYPGQVCSVLHQHDDSDYVVQSDVCDL